MPTNRPKIKLLIVEDYDAVRLGVMHFLREAHHATFELFHVNNVNDAIQLTTTHNIEVVLLDFYLKDSKESQTGDGDEFLRFFAEKEDKPKTIVYSKADSLEVLDYLLFSLGADGYILKSTDSLAEIVPAINAVLEGKEYFSKNIRKKLVYYQAHYDLDYIDRILLRGFSSGMKQKDMIEHLRSNGRELTLSAIEKRIKQLKLRFDANTLIELMSIVIRQGLI